MAAQKQIPDLAGNFLPAEPLHFDIPAADEQPGHSGLSWLQLRSILVYYWKLALAIFVTLTCIIAIVVKTLPHTYTAVATLIVNAGNNRDPLSARESPDDMLANYVVTQTELMLSPVILLPVVDRLKLTEDEDLLSGFTGGNDYNAKRDYVQKNLAAKLEVTQGRGGQLLYVSAAARDPVRAAQIANTLADVYLEEEQHRINGPAGERAERYSSELKELRAKSVAAQDKVIDFQQQHGITDLAEVNSGTETQALDNLGQQLLTAQSQRRSLEAQTVGQEASTNEVMDSELIQELKSRLINQQSQLAQARTVLGPKHPNVLELESQIAATRHSMNDEIQTFASTTSTQLSRAKELEQKLLQAVSAQREKVLELRRLQDEAAKLILERDSAQAVYKHALDGYDQILFAAIGNTANVSIISRATVPLVATKPSKKKLMMIGALSALLLSLAVPIGYEILVDRRLRCVDDLERSFGVPVLAQFEPLPSIPVPT
jgi:protein tyrosine kinase modulator